MKKLLMIFSLITILTGCNHFDEIDKTPDEVYLRCYIV